MTQADPTLRKAAQFRSTIQPAKRAADILLAELGRVMTTTALLSADHDGPSADGLPTFEELNSAINGAVAVKGGLIRAHIAAKAVGRRILPELAWGDFEDTKPEGLLVEPISSLRAVA